MGRSVGHHQLWSAKGFLGSWGQAPSWPQAAALRRAPCQDRAGHLLVEGLTPQNSQLGQEDQGRITHHWFPESDEDLPRERGVPVFLG